MWDWPWRVFAYGILLLVVASTVMYAVGAPTTATRVVGAAWMSLTILWFLVRADRAVVIAITTRYASPRQPDGPEADYYDPPPRPD